MGGEEKESADIILDKMITLPGTASKDYGPASDNYIQMDKQARDTRGVVGEERVPVKVMEPREVAKHDQEESAEASLKPVILIKLPGTAEMDCGPACDNIISKVDKLAGDPGGGGGGGGEGGC